MSDRTNGFLTLWGFTTRPKMEAIYSAIWFAEGSERQDLRHTLETEQSALYLTNINWGQVDTSVAKAIQDAGLNYAWAHEGGQHYGPSITVVSEKNRWQFACLEGEIMLTLSQTQDPSILAKAKACQQTLEKGTSQGLHIVNSAHDVMAIIAEQT